MDSTKNGGLFSKCGDREQDEILLRPYNYLRQLSSYEVSSTMLAKAFNYWFNIPEDKLKHIDDIVQSAFFACLLFDDIEDNGQVRKGIPVAHSIYGVPSTVNAAQMVVTILLQKCLALNHPDAAAIFAEEVLWAHRGQGMEIYWRDNHICPSEDKYFEMATNKSIWFVLLYIRLMQLFSDNKQDFTKLAELLSLYIQIRNDYSSVDPEANVANPGFCDDIAEGKFTLPLIHAISSSAEAKTLVMNILRQRTGDVEVKKYCLDFLERCGSLEYTRNKLEALKKDMMEEVANLGPNDFFELVINKHYRMPKPAQSE